MQFRAEIPSWQVKNLPPKDGVDRRVVIVKFDTDFVQHRVESLARLTNAKALNFEIKGHKVAGHLKAYKVAQKAGRDGMVLPVLAVEAELPFAVETVKALAERTIEGEVEVEILESQRKMFSESDDGAQVQKSGNGRVATIDKTQRAQGEIGEDEMGGAECS